MTLRLAANADLDLAREQPFDGKHVASRFPGPVAKTVFAHSGDAGSMMRGHLGEFVAHALDQGGQETVHAVKWHERFTAFPAHRFQRAASVAHPIPGEPAADEIGDATLD